VTARRTRDRSRGRIAAHPVDPVDVRVNDHIEVVRVRHQSVRRCEGEIVRPAADRQRLDRLAHTPPVWIGLGGRAGEQRAHRDGAARKAALQQRHRPHPDGGDPARARVARLLALGSPGTGEQEQTLAADIVDCPPAHRAPPHLHRPAPHTRRHRRLSAVALKVLSYRAQIKNAIASYQTDSGAVLLAAR
jgi:hypothetical protein